MLFLEYFLAVMQLLAGSAAAILAILRFTGHVPSYTVIIALAIWLLFYTADKIYNKRNPKTR